MKTLGRAMVWGLAVAVLLVSGGQLPAVALAVVLGGWALKA
jgi:hypothetical protein